MKSQSELNLKNELLKKMCAALVEELGGKTGDKAVDAALKAVVGRDRAAQYADTTFAYQARVGRDALADLVDALKNVAENAKPKQQTLSDEKLSKLRQACDEQKGSLNYELLVGGEHVDYFKADSIEAAKKFGKSLRLKGHSVKRVTKGEMQSRSVAFACSPESEAYWCN